MFINTEKEKEHEQENNKKINRISHINHLENVLYINLDERKDRDEHIKKELEKVDITWATRFSAIKMASGSSAVGCSISHLKCIEYAKKNHFSHIMVLEDDIEFLDPTLFKNQLNLFLSLHKDDWDVVIIGGNNMIPYKTVDSSCIRVFNCQTTTGYLVKNHYYDKLIKNIRDGIQFLLKNPQDTKKYAIDKYWHLLQMQDRWYMIIPATVVQREDYSDIEKKVINYKNYMTNINKVTYNK